MKKVAFPAVWLWLASTATVAASPGDLDSKSQGPVVVHLHCLTIDSIDVVFSEEVEQTSAETPANYVVDDYLSPQAALLDPADAHLVHLTGISGLNAGELVDLTVTGVLNQTGDASDSTVSYLTGVVPMNYARSDIDGSGVPDLIEEAPQAFATVQGMVTSAGDFDSRDVRFQDDSGGLAIWDASETALIGLARGDRIRVSGNLSQDNGLDRLIGIRLKTIDQDNQVVPTPLTLAEFLAAPEVYENMLVMVPAVSATGSGDVWPAADQDADLEVSDDGGVTLASLHIDQDTDIDGSLEPAYPIDLVAIAAQYDDAAPYHQGYRLQPRDLADIQGYCQDLDQDGYGTDCAAGPDCDDSDPGVHPGAAELCDGVDNNCDSNTDEDWPELGQPCDGPDDDTCENGTYTCQDDAVVCDETIMQIPETCNGIDDDCDGATDEDLGTYTCGYGECAVTIERCIDGMWQRCDPDPSPVEAETGDYCSDSLDNDCDGFTDEKDNDCRSGTGDGCGCATSAASPRLLFGLGLLWFLTGRVRKNR